MYEQNWTEIKWNNIKMNINYIDLFKRKKKKCNKIILKLIF